MPSPKAPKRLTLPGSDKKPLKAAKLIGAIQPDEQVEVTIRVRRRQPSLEAEESRSSGKSLSRDQFRDLFGADPADIVQIENFAHRYGLTVLEASIAERKVRLSGSASSMKVAFGTNLKRYSIDKVRFRGRIGTISVPQDIHPLIEGVFGLDNRPQARPHFRFRPLKRGSRKQLKKKGLKPQDAGGSTSYTPLDVAKLYQFPARLDGTGQTIGIIELGGGYTTSDLQKYFSSLNVPVPLVSAVSVDSGQNLPSGDPNGPDGEVMLDIEVAGAVAPGARIVVYFAPNSDSGFIDALTTAVHDNVRNPNVLSISWGGPENTWTSQSLQDFDSHCADAALLGITICCSAGDHGSTDSTDPSVAHANVDFPASSPNVLACGGTRLESDGGAITNETVWNNHDGWATGGGISEVFPVPAWQQNVQLPPSVNSGAGPGRGVPDIAGDADGQTGYQIIVDGQQGISGGTSAVSPLWAALIALLNQGLGRPVGFLTPKLYQLPAGDNGLNDITMGDNGGYQAQPGWDACTGLGSPNGAALLATLNT